MQHIYPTVLSYRKSPEAGKWHLAPSSPQKPIVPRCTHSLSQQRSEHWSDIIRRCQSHTWMSPRARAASTSQCCPCTAAMELWRDQSRTGSISLQQGQLSLNLGTRGTSCSSSTLQATAGAGATLPQGRMDLGHRLAPFPCSQEKLGWKLHGGSCLSPFPAPAPATLSLPK